LQDKQSQVNKAAWSHRAYEHWVRYSGPPAEAAAKMKDDPKSYLRHDLPYLGDVRGKRVINLLGSNGRKAVPLALLGAKVTVVDISPEGARYARELAEAAGVQLDYIVKDVMQLPVDELAGKFDLVYMEGGIFHYFFDITALARLIQNLLSPGGRLVAHDFHPIAKCLAINEGQVSLVRNYFDRQLREGDVAYQQFFSPEEQKYFPKCLLTHWTLGEIVTAFAQTGLTIEQLVELPHYEISNLPGHYVLTAIRQN